MADPNRVGEQVAEVYDALHQIAVNYIRHERAKSVMASDLVHEAYLRLAKDPSPHWENRAHFLAIAAIAMRRFLVERARARVAAKRGGAQVQVSLDDALLADGGEAATIDLIALDRALEGLAAVDAQQSRIVELRYFGGLTVEETAEALAISTATVKRDWSIARAWLLRALEGAPPA